ncbi:T3SS effector HopA1 family protein [Altericista sp. CCNU0014]|uniref:T3SS effector HopA1 family protein n=1 Tax=Altericista sp. CCNU0014 TaxID=3082949 RepID=UPI00384A6808
MQRPNFTDRTFNAPADRVLQVLEDIANHVRILPNFHFSHSRYTPRALEPELFNSLQQLSTQHQDDYLRWRLGSYLFSLYEGGGNPLPIEPRAEAASLSTPQDRPFQNAALGVHSPFYERLHARNTGKGYFDPRWQVLRQERDGLFAVRKDGLTVHVGDRHLQTSTIAAGNTVSIRLPSNCIENGCYVAIGNAGPCQKDSSNPAPRVDLFFNLNLEGVIDGMQYFTNALNDLNLPFTFAVPYDEERCREARIAATLTIHKGDYQAIQPILARFWIGHADRFRPEVPLFSKTLVPGLALAEQPLHPFIPQENFGMNRFQIIAAGAIDAWRQKKTSSSEREAFILKSFRNHQVDLRYPYLNNPSLNHEEDDGYSFAIHS